ncbi:17-beta-hydroxysteroid dehydrogenase 13 isoform X1 [Culex quinquefasciatus]|uniref:17-beta-hydroxysteroid dehydrogenase 13 isoform X1 n=1 Tax=Culex quinquefasciatus TaxID=7176 RepID=UPI0018E3832D|nr:17-beta-hydroxysteroid dehydrogenase 13 isoform X1 [Culex quinquefasciatus]
MDLPIESDHSTQESDSSVVQIVTQILVVILDFLRVLFFSVPILFKAFLNLLIPRKSKNVSGQLALITGGANGLGREIALQLAKRGCNIVIVDVDLKSAENTCADLREKGVKAYCYRVDVSSFEQVKSLATTVYQDIGPVDILVNNAGLIHFTFLQDSTEQDVNRLIDVNVKSYIWTTKVFLEKMMDRKRGHIVAISSMSGMYAFPWAVVYSTSKYAVNGFMAAVTEQLRLQGFSDKIQTTCVCPYYIATRKDIVEFLKKPRFKLLTTEHTARVIAKGILRNEVTIAIPPFFDLGVKIMQLFPVKVQQLVRDYIIREYELNSTQ